MSLKVFALATKGSTQKGEVMEAMMPNKGGTVFVLAGGGGLGAVQVGMLYALLEGGIRPDAIVGTSIGALNGAFLAGHPDLAGIDELAELWSSVRLRDVFPLSVRGLARGLFGHQEFLFQSVGLQSVIRRAHLGYSNLEDAPIPIHVVATDLKTGGAVTISEGQAVEALLASSAIPGVFPPVQVGGRRLVDGGVVADVPVLEAEALGATRIYVLPTLPFDLPLRPSNALLMMQRAMSMVSWPVTRAALESVASRVDVRVLSAPDAAGESSMFDFRVTRRLIDEAYEATATYLANDRTDRTGSKNGVTGTSSSLVRA
jgi:NTE family protein